MVEGGTSVSAVWTVADGLPVASSSVDTCVLVHVGAFRLVREADLVGVYGRTDLASARRRFARRGAIEVMATSAGRLWTLAAAGEAIARDACEADQRIYVGLRRRRDLEHDAGVWRTFQWASLELAARRARVRRVIVDAEFRSQLARRLLRPRDGSRPRRNQLEAAAASVGLRVICGRIPLPDVRIEYTSEDGREARWDLEHVTPFSRAVFLGEKVAAGFTLSGQASGVVAKSYDVVAV